MKAHVKEVEALRAEVEALRAEAAAQAQAQSKFLARMSHELRTPLNVIIGLTDLILEEDLPGPVKAHQESIRSAGAALLSIVNDILDIPAAEPGPAELVRADLSAAKALVVDDIQNNLDVAAGLMRKYNLQVDCVSGGQAAVDRIRGRLPLYDVLFMDHMMPEMDGIEAAHAIRALDTAYARDIPIIALTANAIAGTEKLFLDNGFQDFLAKPIDLTRLDAVLNQWVRDRMAKRPADIREDIVPAGQPPNESDVDIPGIDAKTGIVRYGGDADIFLSALRSYADNAGPLLDKLRATSPETLRNGGIHAHGLKGGSANVSAEQIRAAALELELAAKDGDFDRFARLLGPVLKETEHLVADINAWFAAYDETHEKPRRQEPDPEILGRLRQSCQAYDMRGIDEAMDDLESVSYDTGADLVAWLREKVDIMELDEVIGRLAKENL